MSADRIDVLADSTARTLATPICVGEQEKQRTNPALPTFWQTRLHYGTPEHRGNTVAFVFSNNSTNAAEQTAFASKLVRAYNRDDAVAELIEADKEYDEARESLFLLMPGDPRYDERRARITAADKRRRAALARVGGAA